MGRPRPEGGSGATSMLDLHKYLGAIQLFLTPPVVQKGGKESVFIRQRSQAFQVQFGGTRHKTLWCELEY